MKILHADFQGDSAELELDVATLSLLNDICVSAYRCYEATGLDERGIERETVSQLGQLLSQTLAASPADLPAKLNIPPSQLSFLSFIAGQSSSTFADTDLSEMGITDKQVETVSDRLTRMLVDAVPAREVVAAAGKGPGNSDQGLLRRDI